MIRPLGVALIAAAALIAFPAGAQVEPIYDRGAAGLVSALQRLTTTASALHTGAHPDDEDSAFIARTARGDHARVAYLSLNRGEGGQNIIGPELFDALGVIRTEELLQARRLDGGEQFFTRAFDFGFSKTREETAARWDERGVLRDMVRVIRSFRPLVIYSRFSGTGTDGHGHHQMAGHLTPIAFDAAADPGQFPELAREGLRPWQARKLYRGGGRGGGPGNALSLPTGIVAPILGRSYAEIAAEGRSQHKSQGMGTIELLGPSATSLVRVRSVGDAPAQEQSIFDGIDVSVQGLAALAGLPGGALRAELAAMADAASRAMEAYAPLAPGRVVPALVDGLRATRAARAALGRLSAPADALAHADALLAHKEDEHVAALLLAAGVLVDPLADAETVQQGGSIGVTIRTFLTGDAAVRVTNAELRVPEGWTFEAVGTQGGGGSQPAFRREQPSHSQPYRVQVPADAAPTQPYYLTMPRAGDMYVWPDTPVQGLPFAPAALTAAVTLDIGGTAVTVERPVQYRYADDVRGEIRRAIAVVPPVTIALDSPLLIVPTGEPARSRRVVVTATSFADEPVRATVRPVLPDGWTAQPASADISLESRRTTQSIVFAVTAPADRQPGTHRIAFEASAGGRTFARDMQVVAYPHIQTHRLYAPAVATARLFDLEVAPVRVGYIMGSGDQVPDALRRIGVEVTLIDDETLAAGDLSRFDTIVAGIRAAEARPAFVTHHERLRQFMERGGALIVQYQQDYASQGLPPYPAQAAGNSRVTDEDAVVRILEPGHPVFMFPNRIGAADFEGWVQERNLYSLTSFESQYTPLLESADPGEKPQRGGEVYARVGNGHYVYTAYSWFRQLPAGVPGAYRQFANLISLPLAP